ncbi:MAG: fructosamine kinase family protein [Anaerolineaceae bacterium]|nr:fructosamine kinase family protein [Anaerolineaceae bacterium]
MDAGLQEYLRKIITEIGDSATILNIRPAHHTIAHSSYQIETSMRKYLIKYAETRFESNIRCEYIGLKYLHDSKCVHTPKIFDYHDADETIPAYLLMEWIEQGSKLSASGQNQLGEELAALHDASAEIFSINKFGFNDDNYIGNNPQYNQWMEHWADFYVAQRLKPQIKLGTKKGLIDNHFRDELNRLCERIPDLLGAGHFTPCLLHGDLWGGNVLFNKDNIPVLIDPAVYFGVPEAELAFTELFGGFSKDFYQAYDSVLPIPYGYKENKNLYNLYHILNHLNLFGQMYLREAQNICTYYLGN